MNTNSTEFKTSTGYGVTVRYDLGTSSPVCVTLKGSSNSQGAWFSVADIKALRKALKKALPPKPDTAGF